MIFGCRPRGAAVHGVGAAVVDGDVAVVGQLATELDEPYSSSPEQLLCWVQSGVWDRSCLVTSLLGMVGVRGNERSNNKIIK